MFVGHDYGGGVIQQLMIASPELFSGVVLTDSVAFDNWPVAAGLTIIPGGYHFTPEDHPGDVADAVLRVTAPQ